MAIQIAALAILAAFYGVYLGKMLAQRRRGIRTDQMARGNKRGRLFWTELLLKGTTFAVALAEAACALVDWNSAPTWLRWLGLGLAAAGVGVFAASVYTMCDSWRAGIPQEGETELVTAGIYRFSRNPAFLGFDLTYLGLLLAFWNPLLLALSCLAAVLLHLQILQEEAFLPAAFGPAYTRYRSRVCRYLGRRRPH